MKRRKPERLPLFEQLQRRVLPKRGERRMWTRRGLQSVKMSYGVDRRGESVWVRFETNRLGPLPWRAPVMFVSLNVPISYSAILDNMNAAS